MSPHPSMPIKFYLLADPIMRGEAVRFSVSEGVERRHTELGFIIFTLPQWDRFSRIIYLGQKGAGLMRIPVEFRDRTHTQVKPPH